jgi:Tol biopolymer transport system component
MHLKRRIQLVSLLIPILIAAAVPTGAAASFAGKNGRIFFASNLEPTGYFTDIFSMTPRGTDLKPVKMLDDWQRSPTVSSNGRWVAFSSEPEQMCCLTYHAMRANGNGMVPIDEAPEFMRGGQTVWPSVNPGSSQGNPAYSSDGSKIAWRQDDGTIEDPNWNIYVARSDGTNARQLTDRVGDEGAPDFSPNGRRIVYAASTADSGYDIFDIRFRGTDSRRLTHGDDATTQGGVDAVSQFDPDYSPNGKQIIYMQWLGENPDIFKMRADGSHEHALTKRKGYIADPDWAVKPRH